MRLVIDPGAVTSTSKSELRRRLRRKRDEESTERAQQRSLQLLAHTEQLLDLTTGPIAGFQPTNGEPDISALLRSIVAGTDIFLPRPVDDSLEWLVADRSLLVGGLTGIPLPTGPAVATDAEIVTTLGVELLLIPALAVDPVSGIRLGYGAGFYDRLLSRIRAETDVLAVGVCWDEELIEVPAELHDQPVDSILTESGLRPVPTAT